MASLDETCTHIAAVLFYLEAAARIQGKHACTQKKFEWIMPSFLKNVEYLPVKNIDLRLQERNIDTTIDAGGTVQLSSPSNDATSYTLINQKEPQNHIRNPPATFL